jgi:hypothetical protein
MARTWMGIDTAVAILFFWKAPHAAVAITSPSKSNEIYVIRTLSSYHGVHCPLRPHPKPSPIKELTGLSALLHHTNARRLSAQWLSQLRRHHAGTVNRPLTKRQK